jgi:hypothetical protein
MRLPVRIHEAAEAEIQEAADFYDIESLGLSAEFADEIEHAVEHISLSILMRLRSPAVLCAPRRC